MDREQLQQRLLPRLIEAEAVYKSGRSPEELVLLAGIFADDLDGENPDAVDRAFALHRRESARSPPRRTFWPCCPGAGRPWGRIPPCRWKALAARRRAWDG